MRKIPPFSREEITPEFLSALVRNEDGVLFWKARTDNRGCHLYTVERWNRSFCGKPIKIKHLMHGYQGIRIFSHLFLFHRVLWALHYGSWPKGELDHLNGDKSDNRIENLRDTTKAENMRNQKLRTDSTSGFPGVHFRRERKSKPWVARIGVNGTWKTLGYFATREEAIECRQREQSRFGFTARHGSTPKQAA